MVGIDFHGFFADHVVAHGGVSQSLGLHDPFHVGRPAVLSRHQHTRTVLDTFAHQHLFHLFGQDFLDQIAERLERGLLLFVGLFLQIGLFQIETLFGAIFELFSIELLQLLDDVLVNRVDHVDDFDASLLQGLDEGRVGHCGSALAGDEKDVFLSFFHLAHVLFQTHLVFTGFAGVESQ